MARFRDLVLIAREYGLWGFLKRLYAEINDDNVFTNAAAMAYAWMFAVFPFMIVVMTLLPYVPDQYRAEATKMTRSVLADSLTKDASDTIMEQMDKVLSQPRSGLLSLGILLTLFAASGGMNATMTALDRAFDVDKPRKYVWKRIVAMMLTIFMCLCLIIIVVLIPVGSLVTNLLTRHAGNLPAWAQDLMAGWTIPLLTVARYVIGLTVMQILIGVIYHFGRSRRNHRIRFFTPGSIVAALGWIGTGFGMRIYVENFANYSKTYGAVAGMVVMLMVFYFNAIIILLGAEIDSEVRQIKSEIASDRKPEASSGMPNA